MRGIIARSAALGIRSITAEFIEHQDKDPGCLKRPEILLRSQASRFSNALVVFDREGSGGNHVSAEQLERICEERLADAGWRGRSRAIVIEPELETWIWSRSPIVDEVLGWGGRIPNLRTWLQDEGLLLPGEEKPRDPKHALEQALRAVKKKRSSALYLEIARRVSLNRCTDRAFNKLRDTLTEWYPSTS